MTLKTLGRTTWEEIEVGEVFAWEGCWVIFQKLSNNKCLGLSETDVTFYVDDIWLTRSGGLHKLPLSVQRLWRQDT